MTAFSTAPHCTPPEIASGVVVGQVAATPAARRGDAPTPLAALERAVLPALRRPPCLVSFSGGLDSSLVLAVAVRVARREGLAEPVPVTWRFTDAPRADESAWQDRVIHAIGGAQWRILRAADDLDLVGPVARRLLRRHGLLHPVNVHLHLPIVELAAGGSLLTGAGGDQILAGWRRAPRPPGHHLRHLAHAMRVRRPGRPGMFPWLRPEVCRRLERDYRNERHREPVRLDHRVAWHLRRRDLQATCASLSIIAADNDVVVVNPLLDETFLAALTALAGRRRGVRRDQLISDIAGGSLPTVVTAPRPKARFVEVFLRAPTRRFTASWDGSGADESLIDVPALRALWSTWPIPAGTAALVQHLWLAADRAAQPAR